MAASPKKLSTIFLIYFSSLVLGAVSGQDEVDDPTFLKDFSEFAAKAACDARQLSTLKLNLARPMSYHDATTLTFLNKGRILSDQPLEFPQDIQWKRDLVNVMYDIFMAACPDQYVSHDYVKIMRELIMIYLNSVEPRAPVNAEVWQAIQQSLAECKANKRSPYKFTSAGLEILALILDEKPGVVDGRADIGGGGDVGSDEDVSDEAVVQRSAAAAVAASNAAEAAAEGGQNGEDASGDIMLKPQVELAEKVFGDLDTVVDTFWRVFSHAWARCLPTAPSKELWGPRFKQLFFKEFLQPLEERWTKLGKKTNTYISTIVGDIDDDLMDGNLPFCVEAGYTVSELTLHQLVRPVKLAGIESGVGDFQNRKV